MMATLLDGKKVAEEVRDELKARTRILKQKTGITPGLATILIGDDPASKIYVRHKENACRDAGFISREFVLPHNTQEGDLLELINDLNNDSEIHGILVQLPLPSHLDPIRVIEAIDPRKDVDGFHPFNVGRLFTNNPYHVACTPKGILKLLDHYNIAIEGKEVIIVGRSNIVGKPLALLLLNRHATITICHTRTQRLPDVTKRADILIAAVGKPELITADMVREGAVVIDVGINRLEGGRLVGDVAFSEVAQKASYITPVPGGVGPMTIAMLMVNTFNATYLQQP